MEKQSSSSCLSCFAYLSMSAKQNKVVSFYCSPENMGLLDPATSDGRVIFFLPWEKMTIAGTTDSPTDVTHHPIPSEDDINFILNEVRNYLSCDVEGTVNIPGTFPPPLIPTRLFQKLAGPFWPPARNITTPCIL